MHHDVTSCVICISNEVEYLEKDGSNKNCTKEILSDLRNAIKKRSTKLHSIGTLSSSHIST